MRPRDENGWPEYGYAVGNDATTAAGNAQRRAASPRSRRYLALTIVYHRCSARVGDRVVLAAGTELEIARNEPVFLAPGAEHGAPLTSHHVSRRPFYVGSTVAGARVERRDAGGEILVGGAPLVDQAELTASELDRGVVISIGDHVALLAHWLVLQSGERAASIPGIVGASSAMENLRRQLHRVAPHDVPVLLQGESGTGKELAACAIHRLSARADKPFVSVNVAAIPASTAATALFGHEKGAFTGATNATRGYFGQADGGTLFLDEVAEAPDEVQAALLRALESGEVQPVGAANARRVDVRLIAATDADLDERMEEGRFRVPLMMRLSGYELRLPPLRERPDDVARLLVRFLRERLEKLGRSALLEDGDGAAWFPLWLVAECVRHAWPGNVRQLRNVVRQWVIDCIDQPQIEEEAMALLDRTFTKSGSHATPAPEEEAPAMARRAAEDVPEEVLVRALERHRFRPGPVADELGIPRSSLYALMDKSRKILKASDLDEVAIRRALDDASGDIDAVAATLRVSARGLRLRMRALGIS